MGLSKKSKKLLIHSSFRCFLPRVVDGSQLSQSFKSVQYFDKDFEFDHDGVYCYILPPEILVVKDILPKWEKANCELELWFQPKINEVVSAFLVDKNYAPRSLLATFPTEKTNSLENRIPREKISIYDLGVEVLPLDVDVFTMNSKHAFLRGWINKDYTIVSDVRNALDVATRSIGGFISVTSLGSLSTAIAKTLPPPSDSHSTHIILIDRSVDLITPNITQMNYEGLIAEFLGIDCGTTKVSIPGRQNALHILSTQDDRLFKRLCTMNHSEASREIGARMQEVTGTLSKKAETFSDSVENFRQKANITIENQTLVDHINLTEELFRRMNRSRWLKPMMTAEGEILTGNNITSELLQEMYEFGGDLRCESRLLALSTLIKGSVGEIQKVITQLVFNHGLQAAVYLMRLQEAGLFGQPRQKWPKFVKEFSLYNPEWDTNGDHACAAYLGYAPLSVRLVQRILGGDSTAVSRMLSDAGHDCWQSGTPGAGDCVVCFVGGCTHSEINTLRRLGENGGPRVQVLTTNIFSSNEFYEDIAYGIPGWIENAY